MFPELQILQASGDRAALCQEIATLLGLADPVPLEVAERACRDDHFADYLFRSRGHPDLLALVMASATRGGTSTPEPMPLADPSNIDLVRKAGGAMLRWAAGGFKRPEREVVDRRWAACTACPYLREPPERLLYKVTLSTRSDPRVCGACGCVASRKVSLPDEACPVADSEHPGLNRWHEPLPSSALHAS